MENKGLKRGYGCRGKRHHIIEENQFWNIIPHIIIKYLNKKTKSMEQGPLGLLTNEKEVAIVN